MRQLVKAVISQHSHTHAHVAGSGAAFTEVTTEAREVAVGLNQGERN